MKNIVTSLLLFPLLTGCATGIKKINNPPPIAKEGQSIKGLDKKEVVFEALKTSFDLNRDMQFNYNSTYSHNGVIKSVLDSNGDGRDDYQSILNNTDQTFVIQRDGDFDGNFDFESKFIAGHISQERRDSNNDGKYDMNISFKDDEPSLISKDVSLNGKHDIIIHLTHGKLKELVLDFNGDGVPDMKRTFNDDGTALRFESMLNNKGKYSVAVDFSDGMVKSESYTEEGDLGLDLSKSYKNSSVIKTELIDKSGNIVSSMEGQ